MRCLERNKKSLYYALYLGKTPILDSNGLMTGQYKLNYSDPVELKVNISRAFGNTDIKDFGINVEYTHTLVVDDLNCPINETSIIWINRETDKPYNFIVRGKAESINSITYAIKEVSVNEN